MDSSDNNAPSSRKRYKCSNCNEYEHTKRNCPLLRTSFTPLPTPRQSERLQPDDKLDSDNESAASDTIEIENEDNGDDADEEEVEFLWSKWSSVEVPKELIPPSNQEDRIFDDDGIPIFKKALEDTGPRLEYLAEKGVEKGSGALAYFMLFWSQFVFEKFVIATNAFGHRYYSTAWKDVTVAEFKAFIAICLALGYVQYTNREVAFRDEDFGSLFIRRLMTLSRFNLILRCWHWENVGDPSGDFERKELRKANPFWATDDFCILISDTCRKCYCCGQRIDIDEQTVPFKGRHKCRCFNPAKPEKFHLKLYCLNCSKTKYQWAFYFYHGASEIRNNMSATMYPVVKLFTEELWNFNYILFVDNWYTSLPLLKWLVDKGAHMVGTVKTNKQGLPDIGKIAKTGQGKKERGYFQQTAHDIPGENNVGKKSYFTAWQDRKPVHLLSTFAGMVGSCFRMLLDKAKRLWTKMEFVMPSLIRIYNLGMGGTDGFDQWLAMLRPNIKTKTWIPKVFLHILNICVVNSYIIWKLVESPKISSLPDFCLEIMHSLANEYWAEKLAKEEEELLDLSTKNETCKQGKRLKSLHKNHFRLVGAQHCPCRKSLTLHYQTEEKQRKKNHYENNKYKRGHCIICKLNTDIFCKLCDVYLHIDDTNGRDCWSKFHSSKDF